MWMFPTPVNRLKRNSTTLKRKFTKTLPHGSACNCHAIPIGLTPWTISMQFAAIHFWNFTETEDLKMIRQWLAALVKLATKVICLLANRKDSTQKRDSSEILEWQTLKATERHCG